MVYIHLGTTRTQLNWTPWVGWSPETRTCASAMAPDALFLRARCCRDTRMENTYSFSTEVLRGRCPVKRFTAFYRVVIFHFSAHIRVQKYHVCLGCGEMQCGKPPQFPFSRFLLLIGSQEQKEPRGGADTRGEEGFSAFPPPLVQQ